MWRQNCNEGCFWGSLFDIKQKLPIITSAPVSLADEHQKNGPRNKEINETNFVSNLEILQINFVFITWNIDHSCINKNMYTIDNKRLGSVD